MCMCVCVCVCVCVCACVYVCIYGCVYVSSYLRVRYYGMPLKGVVLSNTNSEAQLRDTRPYRGGDGSEAAGNGAVKQCCPISHKRHTVEQQCRSQHHLYFRVLVL